MTQDPLKQQILEEFLPDFMEAFREATPDKFSSLLSEALDKYAEGKIEILAEEIRNIRRPPKASIEHHTADGDLKYCSAEEDIKKVLSILPTPKEIKDCDYCEGMGLRTVSVETDDGRGEIQKEECPRCNGEGKVQMKTNYT